MRVISTSGTRTIKLVLRYLQTVTTSYDIVVKNDNTRQETTIDLDNWTMTQFNDNMGQIEVTFTETYTEGDNLTIKVLSTDGNTLYHRNKIFVTDQVTQEYNIDG